MDMMMARKDNNLSTSVLDRLKALDEERAALTEEAKAEALAQAEAAVAILNSLGNPYALTLRSVRSAAGGTTRRGTRQVDPNKPCPVCAFVTDPPHDARRHRSQGDNKQPFSPKELAQLGLQRTS